MKVTNLSSMSSDVEDNEPIRTRIPPLHKAIRNNEDFIEKLLEYGFVQDINATDNLGFTALHIAVLEKNIKVTETLMASSTIETMIYEGRSRVQYFIGKGCHCI